MVALKNICIPKGSTQVSVGNFLPLSDWVKFISGLAHSILQHCMHMLIVKNCAGFLWKYSQVGMWLPVQPDSKHHKGQYYISCLFLSHFTLPSLPLFLPLFVHLVLNKCLLLVQLAIYSKIRWHNRTQKIVGTTWISSTVAGRGIPEGKSF